MILYGKRHIILLAHLLYIYFAVYYNDTLPSIIILLCQVSLYYFAVWYNIDFSIARNQLLIIIIRLVEIRG